MFQQSGMIKVTKTHSFLKRVLILGLRADIGRETE
jgi:hypothetical protein